MNANDEGETTLVSLGQRLRRLRENRKLSVRELADAVGVSRSFVYQLERGEVAPSYSTLRGISRALGTTISVLVGDVTPEEWMVARHANRKRLILEGGTSSTAEGPDVGADSGPAARVDLITFLGARNRRMQPVVIELEPGAGLEPLPFDHEHEQLLLVSRGEVTVRVLGGAELVLHRGDAAYLLFERAQQLFNHGGEPAELVLVVSPAG